MILSEQHVFSQKINTNMFVHMCICTHFTTSHYVYNYSIHKYIIIHTLLFIQKLMSVVMAQMIAPKYVLILHQEASLVYVILDFYWRLIGLLVMVSTNLCTIRIINLCIHTHIYILTCILTC